MTANEQTQNSKENQSNEDGSPISNVKPVSANTEKQTVAENQQPQPLPHSDEDPLIGTVLDGRFAILDVLGFGGMSVVYQARQLVVDRLVAIKTLHIQLQSKPGAVERFRREIKSLCMLNNPNIVTVYDCIFTDDGQPFVVMDYLQGMSLEQLVRSEGPLKPERAQKIFLQIASALEHAHKNGVIHRDLKPSNVMIVNDTDEHVKVVDFGLAKLGEDNLKLTKSGEVWGSPPYMSPEQWRSEPCDARSDIYALGTVMYEALTGKDAFFADSLYQFLHKHLNETPANFHTANPDVNVPPALERIVFKALAKEADNRFQSMTELKEALSTALNDSRQAAPPAEWKSTGSPISQVNVMTVSGIIAAIAAAVAMTVWFQQNFSTTRHAETVPPRVVQPSTTGNPQPNTPPVTAPIIKPKPPSAHNDSVITRHHRQPVSHNSSRSEPKQHHLAEPPKKVKASPNNDPWDRLKRIHGPR